jgi:hypothetical protein
MFGSFIVGIVFGLGSKFVKEPISKALEGHIELDDSELAVIIFGAVMAVASLLLALLTSNPSPFWLILGGVIGVFGFRLFEFGKARFDATKDDAADAVDAVEDKAAEVADAVKDSAKS